MTTETIDKLFLELSQFTQATTFRELELCRLLNRCDEAINPRDKSAISLAEWNTRLKAITVEIRKVTDDYGKRT